MVGDLCYMYWVVRGFLVEVVVESGEVFGWFVFEIFELFFEVCIVEVGYLVVRCFLIDGCMFVDDGLIEFEIGVLVV